MEEDKLSAIFAQQASFDQKVIEGRKLNFDLETWLQKECLAINVEVAELLNEINYKWWKNRKEIDLEAVKEELVDILHFLISMCIKTGMTADELYARYMDKNKENHRRQDGTSSKTGYEMKK